MSRDTLRTFLCLVGMVLFAASVAMAEKAKTVKFFTDAVLPNGQELKAGDYKVVLNDTAKEVKFLKGNEVVAAVGCKVVEQPKKNDCNEVRYTEKDNKQHVQEIRLGGERRSILLIQGGM
jgi:hypothetical protein